MRIGRRILRPVKPCFQYWVFFHALDSVSNSSDPDQAQCFVEPDLAPNCLQRLIADSTSR